MQSSKLRSWIFDYGPANVAAKLNRQPSTVYRWVRGNFAPRGHDMRALVRLSGGALTADDVLDHFELTREFARAKGRTP